MGIRLMWAEVHYKVGIMPENDRIAYCTDFSAEADKAFEVARYMAERRGARLFVLNVVPAGSEFVAFGAPDPSLLPDEESIVRRAEARYTTEAGVDAEVVAGYGSPAKRIIELVEGTERRPDRHRRARRRQGGTPPRRRHRRRQGSRGTRPSGSLSYLTHASVAGERGPSRPSLRRNPPSVSDGEALRNEGGRYAGTRGRPTSARTLEER